jgi:hypothetical protein
MDRKYILTILAAALIGFFGTMLLMPPALEDGQVRLPWRTALDPAGHTQVFGFTLGLTTLAALRRTVGEDGTLNLFHNPGAPVPFAAEVYFEQVYLQGLRADLVLTLAVDQDELGRMYGRGLRISRAESGAKKIKLDPDDALALAERPIRTIAYLPQARLSEPLLEKRFGTPPERRNEPKTGIVHWLYPARGIDIARDRDGKVVIQYVNPADFDLLREPLEQPAPTGAGATAVAPTR